MNLQHFQKLQHHRNTPATLPLVLQVCDPELSFCPHQAQHVRRAVPMLTLASLEQGKEGYPLGLRLLGGQDLDTHIHICICVHIRVTFISSIPLGN